MDNVINIRPQSSVYATYSRLSYEPWTALAEFVDNSTQSFYDHKKELMDVTKNNGLEIYINYVDDSVKGDYVEIIDNAYGMEWEDYQRAIILDSPPKDPTGRNEYGMGLKTAACWFGKKWTVESTQLGSNVLYKTEIDVDDLAKNKTETIEVKKQRVALNKHYTKIVIRNLNQSLKGRRIPSQLTKMLGSAYRVDLRSGNIKIYYNGNALSYTEQIPYEETIGTKKYIWKKDIKFEIEHRGRMLKVKGFVAIRVPGSTTEAGFALIRRGRVIIGGPNSHYRPSEICGKSNSFEYQRIYGELEMNNWPVTQAKDKFDWKKDELEEKFIEELKKQVTKPIDYIKKAREIREREKVNGTDVIKEVIKDLGKSTAVKTNGFTELPNPPKRTIPVPASLQTATETTGVEIEGPKVHRIPLGYNGVNYIFDVVQSDTNPKMPWLAIEKNSNTNYKLTINMRHAFFEPLIEKKEFMPLMVKMAIALAMAESESLKTSVDQKITPGTIRQKMNSVLEALAKKG